MFVELCQYYSILDGLVNRADGLSKSLSCWMVKLTHG